MLAGYATSYYYEARVTPGGTLTRIATVLTSHRNKQYCLILVAGMQQDNVPTTSSPFSGKAVHRFAGAVCRPHRQSQVRYFWALGEFSGSPRPDTEKGHTE